MKLFCSQTSEKIVHSIRSGMPPKLAAARADLDDATFNQWIKENPDFQQQIRNAEAADVFFALEKVNEAGRNWRAFAWKLQYRYPEYFSARKTGANESASIPSDNGEYDPARGIDLAECNRMAKAWQEHEEWVKRENLVWDSPSQSFIPRTMPLPEKTV